MSRINVELSPNLSLVVALLCELRGVSKSQLVRMALFEYAVQSVLAQEKGSNKNYLLLLISIAIEEASDKELSPQFKQAFLNIIKSHT